MFVGTEVLAIVFGLLGTVVAVVVRFEVRGCCCAQILDFVSEVQFVYEMKKAPVQESFFI